MSRNNPPPLPGPEVRDLGTLDYIDSDEITILDYKQHRVTIQVDPHPQEFLQNATRTIKRLIHTEGFNTDEGLAFLSTYTRAHPFVLPAYLVEMFSKTDRNGVKFEDLRPPFGEIVFPLRFNYFHKGALVSRYAYPIVEFPEHFAPDLEREIESKKLSEKERQQIISRRGDKFKTCVIALDDPIYGSEATAFINAAPGETPPEYYFRREVRESEVLAFVSDWVLDHLWQNLVCAFYCQSFATTTFEFGKKGRHKHAPLRGSPRAFTFVDLAPKTKHRYLGDGAPPDLNRLPPRPMNAHWVRGHWSKYHVGRGRVRIELRYRAPFLRGRGKLVRKIYVVGGHPRLRRTKSHPPAQ